MIDIIALGKRIKTLRLCSSLKQSDIAYACGVTPQAVSKWENGISCPDIAILDELARILGVGIEYILTGDKPIKACCGGIGKNGSAVK